MLGVDFFEEDPFPSALDEVLDGVLSVDVLSPDAVSLDAVSLDDLSPDDLSLAVSVDLLFAPGPRLSVL